MTLLTDLEQATEGSRELDIAIAAEISPDSQGVVEFGLRALREGVPHYTTNLQDALLLVPEGHMWSVQYDPSDDETVVECLLDEWIGGPETGGSYRPGPEIIRKGEKPALALCIACLRAMEAT